MLTTYSAVAAAVGAVAEAEAAEVEAALVAEAADSAEAARDRPHAQRADTAGALGLAVDIPLAAAERPRSRRPARPGQVEAEGIVQARRPVLDRVWVGRDPALGRVWAGRDPALDQP